MGEAGEMLRAPLTRRGPSRGPRVAPGPRAAAEVEHPHPHPQGGTREVPATSAELGHLLELGGPQMSLEKPSSAPEPTGSRAALGQEDAHPQFLKAFFLFPSEVVRFPAEGFGCCPSPKGN